MARLLQTPSLIDKINRHTVNLLCCRILLILFLCVNNLAKRKYFIMNKFLKIISVILIAFSANETWTLQISDLLAPTPAPAHNKRKAPSDDKSMVPSSSNQPARSAQKKQKTS